MSEQPRVTSQPVALRGRLGIDGYESENREWLDTLTEPFQGRRAGRDPMDIPVATLTAAGHGPRRTFAVVQALGDIPLPAGIREYADLRRICLDCAETVGDVRRCSVIDCPVWPYRMGRNPHNPQRGRRPFQAAP